VQIDLLAAAGRHPAAKLGAPDAVRNISLQVKAGEHVAIIGPSGAGKTTLLHLMACALKPSSGQLLLGGQDPWTLSVKNLQALRGRLFLAPQVPPLPPRQRVVTSVLAGRLPHMGLLASLRSLIYPSGMDQADAALARFDLRDKIFERVDRLSGGERQRVGLARILVSQAQLQLVDEPLSALDPSRSVQAIATLCAIATERRATLVATLHHVEMALKNFPRIVGMRDGQIAFDLPASEVTQQRLHDLYDQHLHELTQASSAQADTPATPASPAVMHCR
jgi:phosphonate transport system ATP-binding protein